ncbi:uncharacterized protein LOC119723309 isoform X2 [Patiria miniata]|uniref:PHD-type domain-containing protein n=1 Tax=Patiria miniata TaxID=46514 RepID=A0A913ZE84_PATMI|nr:uncharacterized protein LOC119723309 isoform X2 [Patiria miniata]
MAAGQQTPYWALTFFSVCAASSLLCSVHRTPYEGVCPADFTGLSTHVIEGTAREFLTDHALDLYSLQSVFQHKSVSNYSSHDTLDRLYYDLHDSFCVVPTSYCSLMCIFTKHPVPCACTIWLNYEQHEQLIRTDRKTKFGNAPVSYYHNSTASFNILLTVCGEIEDNPWPVKDPCGSCSRPVKSNQRSLLCEDCNKFWHQKCIPEMSITQCNELISSTVDWFCPCCVSSSSFIILRLRSSRVQASSIYRDHGQVLRFGLVAACHHYLQASVEYKLGMMCVVFLVSVSPGVVYKGHTLLQAHRLACGVCAQGT